MKFIIFYSSSRGYPGHQYPSENEGPFVDNEPVYVPRSTMVDIIYRLRHFKSFCYPYLIISFRGDDELLANRHRGEELIELPSGARQRKIRGRIFEPSSEQLQMAGMAGGGNSEQSEVRRRRGAGGQAKESLVGAAGQQRESKQLPDSDLKVFKMIFHT